MNAELVRQAMIKSAIDPQRAMNGVKAVWNGVRNVGPKVMNFFRREAPVANALVGAEGPRIPPKMRLPQPTTWHESSPMPGGGNGGQHTTVPTAGGGMWNEPAPAAVQTPSVQPAVGGQTPQQGNPGGLWDKAKGGIAQGAGWLGVSALVNGMSSGGGGRMGEGGGYGMQPQQAPAWYQNMSPEMQQGYAQWEQQQGGYGGGYGDGGYGSPFSSQAFGSGVDNFYQPQIQQGSWLDNILRARRG